MKDTTLGELAKAITVLCVRNTFLEDLHSGVCPSSKTGDYSDVKVVTPFGEIPWEKLSRISDREMKRLMKEVVNKIYTFFCRQNDPEFIEAFSRMGATMPQDGMVRSSWRISSCEERVPVGAHDL